MDSTKLAVVGASVLPNIGGWVGSFAVRKNYNTWSLRISDTNMDSVLVAIAASVFPNVGGWLGAIATSRQINTWYKSLKKPTWTPPSYAFGPVWTTLYTSMGYASYLVWRDGGGFEGEASTALALYGTQLALNWIWTPIFFSYHSPKWALVDITLLGISAGSCSVAFYKINQTAGLLMLPYLAWLGIATSLNYYVFANNKLEDEKKD